jgi:hypothetical protein
MDFYGEIANIDLREQLHGVLFGTYDDLPQGIPVILRQLSDTFCSCWDPIAGGSRGHCPYCLGEGYQFTESYQTMKIFAGVAPIYKPGFLQSGDYPINQTGYMDPNRGTAYCEYNVFPNWELALHGDKKAFDKLYELKTDDLGNIESDTASQPVRAVKWRILNVTPLRGDHGRVELFELALEKDIFA